MSIDSEAIVVGLAHGYALLEVQDRQTGCGRCHEPGGCGGTLLSQMRPHKERSYRVLNSIDAAIGDRVVVTIPDGALWRASFTIYLLPLLGVLAGAALGSLWGGESAAIVGSLLGLGAGILVLKRSESRANVAMLKMRFKQGETCTHLETEGK